MARLEDSEDKEHIESVLRAGVATEFWDILRTAIDENIELLGEMHLKDIKDGEYDTLTSDECKVRDQLYAAKVKYLEKLKMLPSLIVESFSSLDEVLPNYDPYSEKEDFLPKEEY